MPKYVVVVEIDGGKENPPIGARTGSWTRYLYEEVEVEFPEQAFDVAEHQVREREGLAEGQCMATGLTDTKLEEWRSWSGLI